MTTLMATREEQQQLHNCVSQRRCRVRWARIVQLIVLCLTMSDGDQYRVRATTFQGREVSVVLQNVNGPCPLLALANILLLRGSISIHADFSHVGYDRLVTLIGDFLMEGNNRQSVPPAMAANYEQNVFDALEQMPFLQFGFDVNVRFDGIEGFEFTSGMSVFDLFNIRLVHGWLYEASDEQVVAAIGSSTYNELTEKLVELDNMRSGAAENTEGIRRYGIIECFLQESASQLTVEGIQRLRNDLAEHELAIFFRNNHFSVIHKHQGDLYLLVTDQGFLYQKKIVWERLEHVHGATAFTDAEFKLYNPENDYTEQPASVVTPADADQAAALAQAA